ncbi:hypothetical protein BU26DRAFT_420876 [Trematosphaeria pertusa]|uniref:Uncharacterized protein n=1 Tax=Trematosphaeria pertusa TaxID=390896 RepID=A0A6A6IQJ9_9PLEO|nr:uncharacterized protein BU26DRAFT_420876 [Trematosphaeria pertusa]KAF2252328.1 hypothetical protein BU26DRAFT_420876 [Trematosphaeria pertusa]
MRSFQPNCTFPRTEPAGFINNPNIRSTLDIVWSCTSIIILSTWSVLHLTVPPDIQAKSKRQIIRKHLYLLQRKLSWMGIMLMFPEYLLAIGASNLFAAIENNRTLQKLAADDGVPWSKTHTIQADMGGVALRFSEHSSTRNSIRGEGDKPDRQKDEPEAVDTDDISRTPSQSDGFPKFLRDFQESQRLHLQGLGEIPWTPFHRHMRLAAEYIRPADKPGTTQANHLAPLHGNIWVLDSKQLALAREHRVIQRLPCIRLEEIQDKSKTDGLVRSLAVIQVGWLIVQLLVRYVGHLPSSALEFSTLAFSSCAIIIYMIEWNKSKDVAVPIYLDTDAVISSAAFNAIAEAAPTIFLRSRHYYMPQSCHIDRLIVLISILSTTLFGGIHLFAWNIEFPTAAEQVLWRTAAILVAVIPSVCALLVLLESLVLGTTDKLSRLSTYIFAPFYLSARVFLIMESFRSLYFLPHDALISTWVAYVPHIS